MDLGTRSSNAAVEIAKIICANPSTTLYPNELCANDIADFIETLQKTTLIESVKTLRFQA